MIEKLWDSPEINLIYVPLPDNPLKNLNCYVIRDSGESLIIDTGFNRPECAEALEAGLDELAIRPDKSRLFVTHLHSDHCGLAGIFVDRGIPIYMGGLEYDYLALHMSGSHFDILEKRYLGEGFPPSEIARQATENQARIFAPKRLFPVTRVSDGDKISVGRLTFSCIHTPGHTPGHICLYCAEPQLLFSGDHILFDITPNIAIWPSVPNSLADYLASLDNIKDLPVARTFPGHRKGQGEARERIAAMTAHHYQRLREMLDVLEAEPEISAYDLAGRISWSARGRPWKDFPPHQRWFAMGETLSHLAWLLDGGYVSQDADLKYRPTGKKLIGAS